MSQELRQKLGQLFIVGFHGKDPEDPWVRAISKQITEGDVGGIILFSYNIEHSAQLKDLTSHFNGLPVESPLFISVDQEGGRVQRLSPKNGFEGFPSAATVAQGSTESAFVCYAAMAQELKTHGINMDFAPCVDVNPEGYKCPVIGELQRSYSSVPSKVVDYARAALDAFHSENILASLKHFPGHGSAQADSHAGFVDVTDHWDERELIPFQQLIKENKVDMVMTAHIFNERFDDENPATLSKPTLDLLRKGYEGVIISDDMHMGGIQHHYSVSEAVIKALKAGCDMVIISNNKAAAMGVENFAPSPEDFLRLLDDVMEAVQSGDLDESRIDEAYHRVITLKQRL